MEGREKLSKILYVSRKRECDETKGNADAFKLMIAKFRTANGMKPESEGSRL